MIQKISFINAFSSKNNFNKNNLKNSYAANPNQVSFKGIFDWTGFERGDYLCFETVDLVNKAKELAKQKKIEEKVFYAKDGTKITFSDAIFWQEYRFENKIPLHILPLSSVLANLSRLRVLNKPVFTPI